MTRPGSRFSAPAWLAGIVVASALIQIVLSRGIAAPWIFADELIYSELAKSFAVHGSFSVRGVPTHGLGFVYPILLAPAWRVSASMPETYVAAIYGAKRSHDAHFVICCRGADSRVYVDTSLLAEPEVYSQ